MNLFPNSIFISKKLEFLNILLCFSISTRVQLDLFDLLESKADLISKHKLNYRQKKHIRGLHEIFESLRDLGSVFRASDTASAAEAEDNNAK